ncbi:MAG: transglycosylase SLT domain-containing protein [Bacteroidales bacterium]|nr:transglycosylase SLT domain-containing protein [Bacteroidales bacterium]
MQQKDRSARIALIFFASLLAGTAVATFFKPARTPAYVPPAHLRAVLELASLTDTSRALVVGYHYELLKRYAADGGADIEIRLTGRDRSCLDSLRAGAVDIVVLPYEDSLAVDSVLVSTPVDSLSVWLMRHDEHAGMRALNDWIGDWHRSADYATTREAFLVQYNPMRGGARTRISPYDSLIRAHADSLGWDWHLLAAVIYQESRFHIEARSPRGAAGLMQMMPAVADRYGVTDPLDPEANIAAGAEMLGNLIRRYYQVGDNMTERYKYALAAYNAGVGRIDDCLRVARLLDVDTGYWFNVVNRVLPRMQDETTLATGAVRVGPFRGDETAYYVDRVIEIYERFRRICP